MNIGVLFKTETHSLQDVIGTSLRSRRGFEETTRDFGQPPESTGTIKNDYEERGGEDRYGTR